MRLEAKARAMALEPKDLKGLSASDGHPVTLKQYARSV
jgi:hypothetical protein